jgi:hypothetical protein
MPKGEREQFFKKKKLVPTVLEEFKQESPPQVKLESKVESNVRQTKVTLNPEEEHERFVQDHYIDFT